MKNSTVIEKKDSVKENKVVAKAVAKVIAKEVAAQKEEEKKMEEAKTVETKKVETKKTETKKAATAKKAPAKKPATKPVEAKKTPVVEEVLLQYSNQEIPTSALVEKVKAAYVAEGHKADSIKKVRVYIKPEENMIYYVVNDDYASGISLF